MAEMMWSIIPGRIWMKVTWGMPPYWGMIRGRGEFIMSSSDQEFCNNHDVTCKLSLDSRNHTLHRVFKGIAGKIITNLIAG